MVGWFEKEGNCLNYARSKSEPKMALGIVSLFLQLSVASLASQLHARQGANFQDQCTRFQPAGAGIANATVTNHAFVAAGSTINLPGGDPSCGQTNQTVIADLCRVSLQIPTSDKSGLVAEIWLPDQWNGRLVTTGNGGLAGCECSLFKARTSTKGTTG